MVNYLFKPMSFALQWHITERCNWNCKHCYQSEDYIKKELSIEQLFNIFEQYISLIKKWNLPKNRATINITGGEPFIRKDFFQLVEKLGNNSNNLNWGILSNGSFLTKKIVKKLKEFNLSRYQVSLEGNEKYNDEIRGKGSFKKVIESIKILVENNIRTIISLTLTKKNINDIPELVKLLDELGTNGIGTRRLIPYGKGSNLKNDLLEPEELKKYYHYTIETNKKLREKNSKLKISIGCESGIFNDELLTNKNKNYCGIVNGRIIIIMPNGDVLPCRRLPIIMGNITKKSLFEIYYSSNKLWELRNLNNAHPFCQKCSNFNQCFGGAKCVTYCYSNKLYIPDIQCWKYHKKLETPEFFKGLKDNPKKELKLHNTLKNESN